MIAEDPSYDMRALQGTALEGGGMNAVEGSDDYEAAGGAA
jgi:hypothetical protein